MTRVHEGMSDPGFTVPDSVETASICRKSGKLAIPGVCDHDPRGNAIYTEYFAKGTVPTESCNVHTTVTVCAESGMLPTEFCPEKISRVCITLPAGETGETDDSYFAIPGYCPIHGSTSTVLPSDNDATSPTVPSAGSMWASTPTHKRETLRNLVGADENFACNYFFRSSPRRYLPRGFCKIAMTTSTMMRLSSRKLPL